MKRFTAPGGSSANAKGAGVPGIVTPRSFASDLAGPGLVAACDQAPRAALPRGEIEFPPLAPPGDVVIPDLPNPSDYWSKTPAVMGSFLPEGAAPFFTRRRVLIGLAVAAALHALLFVGWWLSPPLRIKADYAPDRWVPVLSVPAANPAASP